MRPGDNRNSLAASKPEGDNEVTNEQPILFRQRILTTILLLCSFRVAAAEAPTLDPADDEKHFGPPAELLFWTPQQQVAGYRNMARIFPTRAIKAGNVVHELPSSDLGLGTLQFTADGAPLTIDDYVTRQNVAGLLVIKNGEIVFERYRLGNTEDSVWVSFSVSKSVTSMLVGAAIKDGYIKSVDEKVTDYLPRLKGSAYDQSSIRDLMQMASGVRWNEDYADRQSDLNTINSSPGGWETVNLYEYLRDLPRDAEPGKVFNYNTAETNLVGTLLRSAIGNNLSTYLTEKIWRPFGMQADANWLLSKPGGGEAGGCCISATLRDYARLGLFAMNGGRLADGTEVLAPGWMEESTRSSSGYAGYGYLWWLNEDGSFRASGIFGQGIYVNAAEGIVIAMQSARAVASNRPDWELQGTMFKALVDALRD
jgi:CubicO group peptidase (beta-lactamase class C family)